MRKNNVPFKNQTFTQLIKQIRTKYFDELKGRIKFSKEFKQLVLDKSENKCACCKCKLEDKYHTDHIIPLANNGTNELSNLQALCVGCHMDKTHNEQENGQFVKFSETELNDMKNTFNYIYTIECDEIIRRLSVLEKLIIQNREINFFNSSQLMFKLHLYYKNTILNSKFIDNYIYTKFKYNFFNNEIKWTIKQKLSIMYKFTFTSIEFKIKKIGFNL